MDFRSSEEKDISITINHSHQMSTPFTFSNTRLKNVSSLNGDGLVGSQPPSSSESIFNGSHSDFTGTSKNSLLDSTDLPGSADY